MGLLTGEFDIFVKTVSRNIRRLYSKIVISSQDLDLGLVHFDGQSIAVSEPVDPVGQYLQYIRRLKMLGFCLWMRIIDQAIQLGPAILQNPAIDE